MSALEPTAAPFDQEKAEAFAGKMMGIVNGAFAGLCLSIGHQTGLLETLASLPPSTSDEVAAAAKLNERYVREWLNALTVAGIVEHREGRYHLPAEHAAFLTPAAGPDNLAYFAQYIGLAASVEDRIIESFRNGGGVPYSEYPRFQALQAGDSRAVYDASLLDRTLPAIPGLVARLEQGIDVADIGCGQGHAVNLMARAFPNSRFTGFDFSEEGVNAARAEAEAWGLRNATFVQRDVAQLGVTNAFDFITAFDSIHDQAQPRAVLRNIRNALRPGGTFLMVDIAASSNVDENMDHPMGVTFYAVSLMHCMTVSLAYGGEGLGAMWGEQKARELLAEAGFGPVDVRQVEGDLFNSYYLTSAA